MKINDLLKDFPELKNETVYSDEPEIKVDPPIGLKLENKVKEFLNIPVPKPERELEIDENILHEIKKITIKWKFMYSVSLLGETEKIYTGRLLQARFIPDGVHKSTGPYIVQLLDDDGYDILLGKGRINPNDEVTHFDLSYMVSSKIKVKVMRASNKSRGTIILYIGR